MRLASITGEVGSLMIHALSPLAGATVGKTPLMVVSYYSSMIDWYI